MSERRDPSEILDVALVRGSANIADPLLEDHQIVAKVAQICRCRQNRAGIRLMLSCLLAKVHNPRLDVRKPYTEIGGPDCFSGRSYDESYVGPFVNARDLPCNRTTAFLTPALRNRAITLTPGVDLVGRPPVVYENAVALLGEVSEGNVSAEDLLAEFMRQLLIVRDEKQQKLEAILEEVDEDSERIPLSAEGIVTLIEQHLACPRSSRLPVLVVAAAYEAAREHLGEQVLPLEDHHAADLQTGALGDLEITLIDDDAVVTGYEMKTRRVTREDIDGAIQKIHSTGKRVDNYIFVTTEIIEDDVREYAEGMYEKTGGIEIAILDCIGFLRHFLHLFHRLRSEFLDQYQRFLLAEPDSAVRHELKMVFLALRQNAESSIGGS